MMRPTHQEEMHLWSVAGARGVSHLLALAAPASYVVRVMCFVWSSLFPFDKNLFLYKGGLQALNSGTLQVSFPLFSA